MTKLSALEHLAALAVLVPGAVGLLILARTLSSYWGRDQIASLIVVTMGFVLLLGLGELLLRQRRAALLEHEVRQLPASPSEATVDGASPLLGSLLRARLEQAALPSLGESITPYLTGLLVMLGLLGTLLGLFETVHGASHALRASADVSALRQSLSTPIAGLTRSFGCSAAGISASAMLGLALALVRRREGRALRAVHSYALGPLRVLAPVRRQARALEQLANQGLALPEAASALERVGAQLGELSTRLVATQTAGVETQQRAFAELVGGLREELARAAAEAGSALHARVAPLVEQSLARAGDTAQQQASAMAQAAQLQTSAMADAARQQASAMAGATRQLTEQLANDADSRRQELAREGQARSREAEQLIAALSAHMAEAEGARARTQQGELEVLTELASRTAREAEARERTLETRWSELLSHAEQSSRALREDEAQRMARLDELTARVGSDLARLSGALDEQLARRSEQAAREDERSQAALQQLGDAAQSFEASIARQRGGIEQLVERLPQLFSDVAEASQRGSHAALEGLTARTDERLERISETLAQELTRRLASEQAHDDRALAAMERLDQSAQLLDRNIAQQRETLESFVGRAGTLIAELAEAARASAETTLARLADGAEEQAMRWAKLEAELAEGRLEHARGLEEQLTAHAERLEQSLGDAGAVVQQAAAIWKASSAEMQAIAELFARSVERQREASDAWLESLGDIEASVERSGRHAAADALADQLASTQEVFARQLQFQRELFEQLRTLRTSSRVNASAEHEGPDVSV